MTRGIELDLRDARTGQEPHAATRQCRAKCAGLGIRLCAKPTRKAIAGLAPHTGATGSQVDTHRRTRGMEPLIKQPLTDHVDIRLVW